MVNNESSNNNDSSSDRDASYLSGKLLYPDRINLKRKQVPSHEVPKSKFDGVSDYWVRYGFVGDKADAIRDHLARAGPEIWDAENQESNIRLKRAFHDSLGVKQIIFIFCDDLLKKVYELPWWGAWGRELLMPLFKEIGVPEHLIIRCLLAYLPSGMVIPVHHDTGLWACHSHRVHVPIITSDQFGNESEQCTFKVGHTPDAMHRVPFVQGEVIELNNRAKHMVTNGWDQGRIHLIFDYVEPTSNIPRQKLTPGMDVIQTRRAIFLSDDHTNFPYHEDKETSEQQELSKTKRLEIAAKLLEIVHKHPYSTEAAFHKRYIRYVDGECEATEYIGYLKKALGGLENLKQVFHKLEVPLLVSDKERRASLEAAYDRIVNSDKAPSTFMLIGAMKCGTTSLYDYIVQHPQILRAKQKEPHFFDWRWKQVQQWKLRDKELCMSEGAYGQLPAGCKDEELWQKFLHVFDMAEFVWNLDISSFGEATPSYLLGGKTVAERVKKVAPNTKFIVILRDPVARAYSHFQMTNDTSGTESQRRRRGHVDGKSFETLVEEDLDALADVGLGAGITETNLDVFQKKYLDATLDLDHGSHSYVGRGLYALQLKLWFQVFPREQFYFMRLDNLAKDVQGELNQLFSYLGLPNATIADKKAKNTRSYEPISPRMKETLEAFYEPHNRELEKLLGPEFTF